MNFSKLGEDGYIPIYTRNDLTDYLHNIFGFRTDYEIVTKKELRKIITNIKNRKNTHYFSN